MAASGQLSGEPLPAGSPFALPYGRTQLVAQVPEGYRLDLLAARGGAAIHDPHQAVRHALAHPLGASPLSEWLSPGVRVAIVTSDATRPAMQGFILPPLLEELNQGGIPDEDITLVIGLGIHRPPTQAEVQALLGDLAQRCRLLWSDADDDQNLVDFGATRRGTPVRIFRPVAEADRVILTGSIHHHVMAGFSAGPKSLLPGVAGRDSVLGNHALGLNPGRRGGLNPDCQAGKLDGNPIQEDIADAWRLFTVPTFLLNVVPAPGGGLLQVVAGDVIQAHRAGCKTAQEHYGLTAPETRRLVVASCGGYPADAVFYQSTKALINLSSVLAPGGVAVLAAECPQGVGEASLSEFMHLHTPEQVEGVLRQAFTVPGRVAHYLASILQHSSIVLVSSLPAEQVRSVGMIPAESLEQALQLAAGRLGPSGKGYLIPQSSYTVPSLPPERH